MEIKKAAKKDLKEIASLMKKEIGKPPFNEKDSINFILKSLRFYLKNSEIYISTENKIEGVLIFQVEQWWEGKVIIIQDLVVSYKFQKKGIGKNLMVFIEKYAKKIKAKRIYFETNKKSSAIKFYKKMGYKINKDRISMNKKMK
ncbi:MAG TPA: GNAT family N-acetyltransferase [Candidatus Pacearchaeota archaeon]|nr:GNAT family N-acetyltransferase [Candidatus Pacearchaeota archaeon]